MLRVFKSSVIIALTAASLRQGGVEVSCSLELSDSEKFNMGLDANRRNVTNLFRLVLKYDDVILPGSSPWLFCFSCPEGAQ